MKFVVVDPGTTTGVLYADLSGRWTVGVGVDGSEGDAGLGVALLREGLARGSVKVEEVETRRWWEPGLADRVEKAMKKRSASGQRWQEVPLVIEDFLLRTQDKRKETLDPIRVTSVLIARLQERGWDGRVHYQQPSDMTVATDKRLRHWKLWIKGMRHGRDAMRHAVVFLRKNPEFLR